MLSLSFVKMCVIVWNSTHHGTCLNPQSTIFPLIFPEPNWIRPAHTHTHTRAHIHSDELTFECRVNCCMENVHTHTHTFAQFLKHMLPINDDVNEWQRSSVCVCVCTLLHFELPKQKILLPPTFAASFCWVVGFIVHVGQWDQLVVDCIIIIITFFDFGTFNVLSFFICSSTRAFAPSFLLQRF